MGLLPCCSNMGINEESLQEENHQVNLNLTLFIN